MIPELKQVIIFGRHAVRSPVAPNSILNNFSLQPFPEFSVPGVAILTANGARMRLSSAATSVSGSRKERLLTGNDSADAAFVYFRANVIQRTIATAQAFAAGMLPAASVNVNSYGPQDSDPLFDPVGAGVARLD